MIYHELFGQHLRLGNFLFKYAWSIAMKDKFGVDSVYPESYYFWKYLRNKPLTILNETQHIPDAPLLKSNWEWSLAEEKRLEEIVSSNKNIIVSLDSFFQSEKWFQDAGMRVYDGLMASLDERARIYHKYKNHLGLFRKPTIGIGVRLGDFQGHGDFYQIPWTWYFKVLNEQFPNWREEYNVMIFSDDIELTKQIFGKIWPNFMYAEPNGTHTHADDFKHYHGDASEQFILGTMMDHWIIGNSTFNWWQAWLSSFGTDRKVVHSGKVFSETGRMKNINTEHYYPERWFKVEV